MVKPHTHVNYASHPMSLKTLPMKDSHLDVNLNLDANGLVHYYEDNSEDSDLPFWPGQEFSV